MVCLLVAQSRDAKELINEEATRLAMLAMDLSAVDIVDTTHVDLPDSKCGALAQRVFTSR